VLRPRSALRITTFFAIFAFQLFATSET